MEIALGPTFDKVVAAAAWETCQFGLRAEQTLRHLAQRAVAAAGINPKVAAAMRGRKRGGQSGGMARPFGDAHLGVNPQAPNRLGYRLAHILLPGAGVHNKEMFHSAFLMMGI